MFRAKVWLPIAVISSAVVVWCVVELIRFRPDYGLWVGFMLALCTSAVSWVFTLMARKPDQAPSRQEVAAPPGMAAFDQSNPRIRLHGHN